MRIGNINEMSQSENRQVTMGTTNYSKADYTRAIRLDITDIGKDTGFIIDQGRSIQDVIGEAGALDVQTRQDYMTVVSNTMSEEDYAKMCEEGFKPSQMSGEESVTIMDRIKAVVAQSGEMVAGYNDNLDIDTLKEITGSVANANALAEAMKNADIPQTEANAKKIDEAAKEIQGIDSIDDSSMQYMLMNNLSPTIDNIYLAKFSVGGVEKSQSKAYYSLGMQGYLAQKADTADIANIKGDIEKALEGFNLEEIDYDTQIKEANWLVEKGIDLTQSNMEKLHELTGIKLPLKYDEAARKAAYTLAKGNEPKKTDLSSSEDNVYVKASEILEKTSDIEDNQIKNVVLSGKSLTLKNIWNASNAEASVAADNISFTQGRAAIEEIRLRMTLDVNVSLLKRGIELDTMSLSNLVDALKAGEKAVNESLFGHEDAEIVEAKATIYSSVSQNISDIPFMPAAVIGRLKIEEEYSLTTVHEIGTDLKARYEAAGESYETLMTAPGNICAVSTLEDIHDKYGFHILDHTIRLIAATWEGEQKSFSSNMLNGVARLLHCYGDDIKDSTFKEKLGAVSIRELSRTAKDRRAGSLGYSEAMLIAYNKKTQFGLPQEKLYSKKAKKEVPEEIVESPADSSFIPTDAEVSFDNISQMDIFTITEETEKTDTDE